MPLQLLGRSRLARSIKVSARAKASFGFWVLVLVLVLGSLSRSCSLSLRLGIHWDQYLRLTRLLAPIERTRRFTAPSSSSRARARARRIGASFRLTRFRGSRAFASLRSLCEASQSFGATIIAPNETRPKSHQSLAQSLEFQ